MCQIQTSFYWQYFKPSNKNFLLIFCLFLISLTFCLSLRTAFKLQMHNEPSMWQIDAVPPALSRVAFNHERLYTSLNFVHDAFYNYLSGGGHTSEAINDIIVKILNKPVLNHSDRLLGSDDKGIVTLTQLSFRLFGYKMEGLFYLYYIILGTSAIFFAYSYKNNPFSLLLLSAFFLIHSMVLPMIKYNGQLGNILALRCMPLLGIIACMHCILFFFESTINIKKLMVLSFQLALLVFIVHIRSTAIWEVVLVMIVSVFAMLLRKGPGLVIGRRKLPVAFIPLIMSLAFMLMLNHHRAHDFPEEYYKGEQIVTRVFWHNIFSGLVFNPNFAKRYELRIDDISVIRATGRFLLEMKRQKDWEAVGGTTPNYAGMRWQAYDDKVKDMLFARCQKHFGECLSTFVYYKPLSLAKNLLWMVGLIAQPPDVDLLVSTFPEVGDVVKQQFNATTQILDSTDNRGQLWWRGLLIAISVFAAIAILCQNKNQLQAVLITVLLLALGSMIPTLIGYPALHTVTEAAVCISIFIVISLSSIVLWVFSFWHHQKNKTPDQCSNNKQRAIFLINNFCLAI